ncbi:MAG: T9SS type A sorting domain-containing protein [Ignavibacteriae bacterium]|nr:T9SS type A sorting domain-containing protein [Ignavibacteriota bacterium]
MGGIVTCTRPLLSAGTAPSITIIGTAPPNAGIISNTATVSGAVTDPVASNNSTTITTTVNPVSTITQAIQNLIRQVECLVSSGILNAGNGNALIAKLHAALQSVDRGNSMSAANQLQAFINEVNALMQSGRLSASDGQPLIAGATVAINLLPAIEPGNLDGRSAITVLDASTPTEYVLSQNYPNPFNPATAIQFSIVTPGRVSLIIYNTLGEEVARLIDRDAPPGKYEIRWDASQLQSGIYFYRLLTRDFVETKKLIMMK